jgi:UDP-N-acetylglucosamine 4,6-dehydratase/5-epimerase
VFTDSTILITGGTGTFGNALLWRFLSQDVKEIRIFSRDEAKQHEMRIIYDDPRLSFYIGDVRRPESLVDAMEGVDHVFHAAALKHVPSCEFCPMEALLTNAVGTENVLDAAVAAHVKRIVVLSTDKAAYPVCTMGISKALMEKLAIAKSHTAIAHGCTVVMTRCGNLLASRGSVVPLFISQIRAGKPLTVTDPQMTRFIMSIERGVDLVLFAHQHGHPGELFVPKVPATTIETLANALKRMFQVNNPVQIIGMRPGEKAHETLLTQHEMARAVDLGNHYCVPADKRRLNYHAHELPGNSYVDVADYDSSAARCLSEDEVVELLANLEEVRREIESWHPAASMPAGDWLASLSGAEPEHSEQSEVGTWSNVAVTR